MDIKGETGRWDREEVANVVVGPRPSSICQPCEKGSSDFHYLQCSPVNLHISAVEVDFPSLSGRNLGANKAVRTHSDIVAHHALIHG